MTGLVAELGVLPMCDAHVRTLVNHATIAKVLGYVHKLDLVLVGKLLDYPLFMNNLCQCQHMIGDPALRSS